MIDKVENLTLLTIVQDRLEAAQAGPERCGEFAVALMHTKEAIRHLRDHANTKA